MTIEYTRGCEFVLNRLDKLTNSDKKQPTCSHINTTSKVWSALGQFETIDLLNNLIK